MNSWNSWNSWNSFRWNLLFVERFFVLQQACCLDSATAVLLYVTGSVSLPWMVTLTACFVRCLVAVLVLKSTNTHRTRLQTLFAVHSNTFTTTKWMQGKNKATKKQITKETLNAIHLWISLFANLWGNFFNYSLVTRALNTTNREVRSRSRSESLLRPDHRLLATMIIRELLFNLFTFNYCYIVLHTKESLITMILFSSFAR